MAESATGLRIAVTGAGGGIGSAVSAELRKRGADVISLDLTTDQLEEPCHALDVTAPEVEEIIAGLGSLDGLVLAHGITALGPASEIPMPAVRIVLEVNLLGSIAVARAALPGLRARRGRIAVLSSVSGFAPLVDRTAYAASKHGLHGWFESLRSEERRSGVSVTMVAPSFVPTGIEERAAHRAPGAAGEWSTTGELTPPAELSRAIVDGLLRRKRLVLPSRTARVAWILSRVLPGVYTRLMERRIRR